MTSNISPKDMAFSVGKPLTEEEFQARGGNVVNKMDFSGVGGSGRNEVNKNSKFVRDLVAGDVVDNYGRVVLVESMGVRTVRVTFDNDKEFVSFGNMLVTVQV